MLSTANNSRANEMAIDREDFLTFSPLYASVAFPALLFATETLDSFCTKCKKMTTFVRENDVGAYQLENKVAWPRHKTIDSSIVTDSHGILHQIQTGSNVELEFRCPRCRHYLSFYIQRIDDNNVRKVGQSESILEIAKDEFSEFKRVLTPLEIKYFRSAKLCSSHGQGIGAFAYLRIVFENHIAKLEEKYGVIRGPNEHQMSGRIKKLKPHLPISFNGAKFAKLFGLLSSAVHGASDEEACSEQYANLERLTLLLLRKERIAMDDAELEKEF
jgi:phage FluMu protein Com